MKLAILPGSFKPPHHGHYILLKKLIENPSIDVIYIIISNKPRYLVSDDKKSGEINAYQSEKIWKIYLNKLEKKYPQKVVGKKIYIMISKLPSPIMMAYAIAKKYFSSKNNKLGKNNELILVKSSKNAENTRFDSFKDFGVKIDIWDIPKFKTMSSTNMRKTIYKKNKKVFNKFLPNDLDKNEINEIKKILKLF